MVLIAPEPGHDLGFLLYITLQGAGNGSRLQDYCLENLMDGGAWQATVHGVAKSQTRLSNFSFTFTFTLYLIQKGFPGGSVVKNPPVNARGNAGDVDQIPGQGRSPKEEMATHSNILAQKTPWTEEPGGLEFVGSPKSWTRLSTHVDGVVFLFCLVLFFPQNAIFRNLLLL